METIQTKEFENEDIEKNKDIAAVAWMLVLTPILLVLRRDSEFIQFHSRQAIILFIIGGLIFALPKPLSYLNIFTLAVAITGFLNANMGKHWKVPFLYDLVEKGLTPTKIAIWLRNFIFIIFDIIKRIFTDGPGFAIRGTANAVANARGIDALKVNSRVDELIKENKLIKTKSDFLEKELLLEKYLRGKSIKELQESSIKNISKIRSIFVKKENNIKEIDTTDLLDFQSESKNVLVGNFDEEGLLIFTNFKDDKKFDISFGSWHGIAVIFDKLNESQERLNKLSEIFNQK